MTSTLAKKIVTLDNWCLRDIFHIHWKDFVTNNMVWSHTGQPLPSWRLFFFGHIKTILSSSGLYSGSSQRLATQNRKTKANRLKTVEDDMHPLKFSLATDWRGTYSWRRLPLFDMLQTERVADCLETRIRCGLNACTEYKTTLTFEPHN